ncbi:hypothetical protein [Nocardia stercoris]|uniref:Uncharacterized protein n=1 Tax=Nocardia stercoris TaxID=2483361 RepID=A0A3M2KZX5_9NOCA|nr:hypothetical protein [Nocardia stercoris]RMI27858.1 hypothetical protein EBN03_32490 [Nocardia stercoris]
MRTFVHLVLFACAIALGVGTFGPLVDSVSARHLRFTELRDGLPTGSTFAGLAGRDVGFNSALTPLLLIVAGLILIAALVGSRLLGWLGVLAGFGLLGVFAWRFDQRFDAQLRDDYRTLLSGTWGLYLVGGALVVALLALLVPKERVTA